MRVSEYDAFVRKSDQYQDRPQAQREAIAIYGLVGEIGSLASAVKKQLLFEDGQVLREQPNEEIIEELGDIIWYCISLTQVVRARPTNILGRVIILLKNDMTAEDERSRRIQAVLDKSKKEEFLLTVDSLSKLSDLSFGDYQKLAFLTARTSGRQLLEVCLTVLWQLGAELMRRFLPPVELELNKAMANRRIHEILGDIAWHVAAVASLYKLSLDEVAAFNQRKVSFRQNREDHTPLHDEDSPLQERLPRQFEVAFVQVGPGRTRMYMNGRQVGDELTDNAYSADGYRFHDVMHLANAAMLGWSPVFRGLIRRKRKSNPQVDEVEDGARAKIVEELIIKAIHAEGKRLGGVRDAASEREAERLFKNPGDLTFRFLKSIRAFAAGLEVEKNRYWEWEDAILRGYEAFYEIGRNGGGTIRGDLSRRTLEFSAEVELNIAGTVCGVGSDIVSIEVEAVEDVIVGSLQRSTLVALGQPPTSENLREIKVTLRPERKPLVQVTGRLRESMWRLSAVAIEPTLTKGNSHLVTMVLLLSDPNSVR